MKELEKNFNRGEIENKWQTYWREKGIFNFNWEENQRENMYLVDTPPPGVSGTLHMGHVFGYSQMDMVVRFQRMQGKNVYFPIGYDDNGLPSERYVEKKIKRKSKHMDRSEFIKICNEEIRDAENSMENLFGRASYSFDFRETYRTISETSSKISQMSFLDLYARGLIYQKEGPILWDITDQTAIAQSELEDRDFESQMNYIEFGVKNGTSIVVMTTRPELLPACVALMCHPEIHRSLEEREIETPLGVRVPIIADEKVDREKGTGFVMCCTFGDQTDVDWWGKYNLKTRIIIDDHGLINMSRVSELINQKYLALEGLSVEDGRKKILELLGEDNKITRNPEKITHSVRISERSKSPIEFLVKKQWFIRTMNSKDVLHRHTDQIEWKPNWMKTRLHNWIEGLTMDWCISRQRSFGIPIPLWYSKRDGEQDKILTPRISQLPIDPLVDIPDGYGKDEIYGESDIMDTWATSALTPQLASRGINADTSLDPERYSKLRPPFDLRAQGHDILRTWAFYTILRTNYHGGHIPWKNIMVNGWCLASDGTKMSKSLGNTLDPIKIFDQFGSDALRYWTAKSTLGIDNSYQENLVRNGQKLIIKLYNCAKFLEIHLKNTEDTIGEMGNSLDSSKVFETMDLWLLVEMNRLIENYNKTFSEYEYSKALESLENFFWHQLCDNYLEIVKIRCYGPNSNKYKEKELAKAERDRILRSQRSALETIYHVYRALLKMFAPFVPVICEEIYSCLFEEEFTRTKSIHSRGNCAKAIEMAPDKNLEAIGLAILQIVADVRKYKSEKGISLKETLEKLTIHGLTGLESAREDIENVCNTPSVIFLDDTEYRLEIAQ
ncbi:MAG: valine--tRNA ligase [Rickettsiales bacterium]|jgi:valyl-tRNA synthetase|nr:valine--tRNA ligase [Rickettsiales bacterium]